MGCKVSRRTVLKAAVMATGAYSLAGLANSAYADNTQLVVSPQSGLKYDKEMKVCFSSGAYNCGSRCHHKIHYKNGKLYHMTSAGDIPRKDSAKYDESEGKIGNPIQRRACVRGYGYISRIYQPDRIKYPMMRDPKYRGDITKFRRVTWEEAIEAATDAFHAAYKRLPELGYVPLYENDNGTDPNQFLTQVGPAWASIGNESTGSVEAAKFDMLGLDAFTNNISDRLNSKFIVTWALDPSRTTYWVEHAHWFNTKAKEGGAEMVVISPTHSDSAAMLSTGVKKYKYKSFNGEAKEYSIPGWIPIRPSTDGALAAAMAYVIWKNRIFSPEFVNNTDKCFGFYSDITKRPSNVVRYQNPITSTAERFGGENSKNRTPWGGAWESSANLVAPRDFHDAEGRLIKKGQRYKGAKFAVPDGAGFADYLESLEVVWAGAKKKNIKSKFPQPEHSATPSNSKNYYEVLRYASSVTGVPVETIEALAFKYATTSPSFLDVGGGAQRAWNGVEWAQLCIALTTMTGHIDKPGGGAGFAMTGHTDTYGTRGAYLRPSYMSVDVEKSDMLHIPIDDWAHFFLHGKDYRDMDHFIADNNHTGRNLVKPLSVDKPIEIDVWVPTRNEINTHANLNKTFKALEKIKTIICFEQVMTPTAMHADIVFACKSHLEGEGVGLPQSGSAAIFKYDPAMAGFSLYDTKWDPEINLLIMKRLNEKYGYNFNVEGMPETYWHGGGDGNVERVYNEKKGPAPLYLEHVDPEAKDKAMSYEEFNKVGIHEWPIPKGKSIPGMKYLTVPGKLQNTTGRINLYAPFWDVCCPQREHKTPDPWDIKVDGYRNPTVAYQPNIEGFETMFDNFGDANHPSVKSNTIAYDKERGRGSNYGNPLKGKFTGYYSKNSGRHYTLQLMTNKARNRAHTVFDNTAMIKDQFPQCVHMNPVDANARGIKDGQMAYIYNDRGCVKIPAKVSDYIVPGVVSIEHGAWYRPSKDESVSVWLDTALDQNTGEPIFKKYRVPVDLGGTDNVLTLNVGGKSHYIGQALNAQGNAVEISATHPEA